jgi:hypothetical protein
MAAVMTSGIITLIAAERFYHVMMGPNEPFIPSSWRSQDTMPDSSTVDVTPAARCNHKKTKSVKSFSGNFVVMRTVCESCGRVVEEENVLMGLERLRCPVDPRLDRCLTSCPVEEGSLGVFENPCEPVRNALESSGFVAIAPANGPETEPSE